MTSLIRPLAVAFVLSLLLVPALVRAGQPLVVGQTAVPGSSFSKSIDIPPDPVVVVADSSPQPIDCDALLRAGDRAVADGDEILPPTPFRSNADSLRAPPAGPLA